MKLIQVLFTLIIISGCKSNNSKLASTNSGQTNKRAAHSFCRSSNQIRLGSNDISQAKSDLMVLLSLGNNVQQGWRDSTKTDFYKGDTFVSDAMFESITENDLWCISTLDLMEIAPRLIKDQRAKETIEAIRTNLANGDLFNIDSSNMTNTTVNAFLNILNGLSEMIRSLIHAGIMNFDDKQDGVEVLVDLEKTGILHITTKHNDQIKRKLDLDLNTNITNIANKFLEVLDTTSIDEEEKAKITNAVNLARIGWFLVKDKLTFEVEARCSSAANTNKMTKFKCNADFGFGESGRDGVRLPLSDPRDADIIAALFQTGPQSASTLSLMLGYDCSPLVVEVKDGGYYGSNLCRKAKAAAEMTYIFGKTSGDEVFEDVSITLKNIGLALNTINEQTLKSAWFKGSKLKSFENGSFKDIPESEHKKFVYKGVYSSNNNENTEFYTDSCIAPRVPFKTQQNPSDNPIFKDSDGSQSGRWSNADYTCNYSLPQRDSHKRIRCQCTGLGSVAGIHYFRDYKSDENTDRYCRIFKLINKNNLPASCTDEAGQGEANEPEATSENQLEPSQQATPTTTAPSNCTDIAPDTRYTCEQQAEWGKCTQSFMANYCDKSCGRCQ